MSEFLDVTLDSVLCNSAVPVVNRDGVAPYFKSGLQKLCAASVERGPAIIALNSGTAYLTLAGTCGAALNGNKVRISSTWEGFPNDMRTPTSTQDVLLKYDHFIAQLPLTHISVPWGFKGVVTWTFELLNSQNSAKYQSWDTSIEFYVVSPWCYEFLARDGIELDLLRFFVLTTRFKNYYVKNFAAHVVTQVHYHSGFTYNILGGTSRYVEQSPWHFRLNTWLKDLGANKNSVNKYTLNCIDLAQIVGITVSLCFKNAEDAENLRWCSMMPFGFIKPVHLIGFEKATNNPFVDHYGKREQLVQATNETRQPFFNHWFIMWNEKILDATCGPQVGLKGIEQYLAGAIDPEYNHETSNNKDKMINGTINNLSQTVFTPMLGGPILEYQAITGYDPAWVGTNPEILASVSKLQAKGDIQFKLETLIDTLNSRCGPTYILEPEGLFHLHFNPSTPELGNTIRWPIRCEHNKVISRLDLQITVFDSPKRAIDKTISLVTTGRRTVQNKGPHITRTAIVYSTNGPDSVHMYWSYGHLFVDLFGIGIREHDVLRIVDELQVYLEEAGKTSHPEPAAIKSGRPTSDHGSLLPSSMAVNTTEDVFIKVPTPPQLAPKFSTVVFIIGCPG